ncbi:hypothetical protein COK06_11650 [Bacillus cereus]|uniref:Uncharacterized protein n=1 Tax=Bacillus cereus TaxID=1396 RepID=A0A2B2HUQ4_BACCE|nr:hypothetical protein CON40_28815 [Bacillus cereus]PEV96096.1 hypothetical protein CN428_27845 [Bacillus cereus]PEZ84335.1 hypothetical protein CN374_27970 [Bacillus cereus]PFE57448.1 hypothetical protein CN318_05490 [Bacillus cereus]PFE58883.1 hypothetical protein CN316_29515 [Bacillus cereus]
MEDYSNGCIGIEFLKIKLYCKSAVGTGNYLLLGSLKVAEDKGEEFVPNNLYIVKLFIHC